MRQANLFMMSAAMLLAACGGTKDAGKTDQVLIEKSDIKPANLQKSIKKEPKAPENEPLNETRTGQLTFF